jgi:acetoin utilization deacetylase AcuC-like enzyme
MLLYDPGLIMRFRDYGIMLPISASRAERILESLSEKFVEGTRSNTMPYPGPVLDIKAALAYLGEEYDESRYGGILERGDLERVHSKEFIASLLGEVDDGVSGKGESLSALEKALLNTYELIDENGKPHRYEPELAVKPLSALFNTITAQVAGTYLACRLALAPGPRFCFYFGGGMHHARFDSGSGFCLLNDVSIA